MTMFRQPPPTWMPSFSSTSSFLGGDKSDNNNKQTHTKLVNSKLSVSKQKLSSELSLPVPVDYTTPSKYNENMGVTIFSRHLGDALGKRSTLKSRQTEATPVGHYEPSGFITGKGLYKRKRIPGDDDAASIFSSPANSTYTDLRPMNPEKNTVRDKNILIPHNYQRVASPTSVLSEHTSRIEWSQSKPLSPEARFLPRLKLYGEKHEETHFAAPFRRSHTFDYGTINGNYEYSKKDAVQLYVKGGSAESFRVESLTSADKHAVRPRRIADLRLDSQRSSQVSRTYSDIMKTNYWSSRLDRPRTDAALGARVRPLDSGKTRTHANVTTDAIAKLQCLNEKYKVKYILEDDRASEHSSVLYSIPEILESRDIFSGSVRGPSELSQDGYADQWDSEQLENVLICAEDFPGKDAEPKKSILKKQQLPENVLNLFQSQPRYVRLRKLQANDDAMSYNSTLSKKRVQFDV